MLITFHIYCTYTYIYIYTFMLSYVATVFYQIIFLKSVKMNSLTKLELLFIY